MFQLYQFVHNLGMRRVEERGREGGYGSIDRELGRYDIIVTNIESILYYCTSIFVIINPNRVTRGEMERETEVTRHE